MRGINNQRGFPSRREGCPSVIYTESPAASTSDMILSSRLEAHTFLSSNVNWGI